MTSSDVLSRFDSCASNLGVGLVAILSIIRLRSSAVTQQEVAYYFVALVLGLVNGINMPDRALLVAMNLVLLLAMLIFDSRVQRDPFRRLEVNLKHVYTDEAALTAELQRQLGGGYVVYQEIRSIDLVHHHLTLDVRLRRGPLPEQLVEKPATTTDKPAAGAAAAGGADEVVPALSVDGFAADGRDAAGWHSSGPDRPTEPGGGLRLLGRASRRGRMPWACAVRTVLQNTS